MLVNMGLPICHAHLPIISSVARIPVVRDRYDTVKKKNREEIYYIQHFFAHVCNHNRFTA